MGIRELFTMGAVRHCTGCPQRCWCPIRGDIQGQGMGLCALLELLVSLCSAGSANRRPSGVPSDSNHSLIYFYKAE